MSFSFLRIATVILAGLLAAGCIETVTKVKFDGSEESIRKEAARNKPVAWQELLGEGRVDDMAPHTERTLFVSIRRNQTKAGNQHAMLFDTVSGRKLWDYDPAERKGEYRTVLMLEELIVLRFDHDGASTLVAISGKNGREIWSVPAARGSAGYAVLPTKRAILAIVTGESGADMSAYDLASGRQLWTRRFPAAGVTAAAPIVRGETIFSFYGGVQSFSARDGKTIWSRSDIALPENGVAPRMEGDFLYVLDKGKQLHRLAVSSGKGAWTARLATGATELYNIFPHGERIYLRGKRTQGSQTVYPLVALSARNGKILWIYNNDSPIVSNLIEIEGRVYYATASRFGALDLVKGSRQVSIPVTNSGRTYPVQLRLVGEKLVFIGELIVAALDVKKSRIAYKHGFDPVAPSASITALDGHIEKLESQLAKERGRKTGDGMAAFHSAQAAHWQERSNYYYNLRYSDHSLASSPALGSMVQMNNKFARDASRMAFEASLRNLGDALAKAIKVKALAEELESEEFLRRSILLSYGNMVTKDYVYRPTLVYRSSSDQFISLAIVDLQTGRIARTSLSAPHDDLGLWSLLDAEKGVAYHQGVGLDPSRYSYTGKPAGAAEYLNSFLIAQPVKLPK